MTEESISAHGRADQIISTLFGTVNLKFVSHAKKCSLCTIHEDTTEDLTNTQRVYREGARHGYHEGYKTAKKEETK